MQPGGEGQSPPPPERANSQNNPQAEGLHLPNLPLPARLGSSKIAFAPRSDPMRGPAPDPLLYALCILVLLGVGIWAGRKTRWHWTTLALLLAGLVPVPPAGVMMLLQANQVSSTLQFNAGSEQSMDWWSLWVSVWGLSMLAIPLAALASLVVLCVATFRRRPSPAPACPPSLALLALGVFAHLILMFFWVGANWPDA